MSGDKYFLNCRLQPFSIRQTICFADCKQYRMHIVTDVSKKAPLAVVYLRVSTGNRSNISLVVAWSRLNSSKDVSYPHIEAL